MDDSHDEKIGTSVSRIPRFNGKRGEDYGLWRLRLKAICRIKGVWAYVQSTPTQDKQAASLQQLEIASAIIISALGDTPLRVVADSDGNPRKMLQLLDSRYATNRTGSRIAVQTQLYRM